MATEEKKDAPRLYSKPSERQPVVDVVAPDQQDVHELLDRWGLWNAVKRKNVGCSSVESLYREKTDRQTGQDTDPLIMAMERAVLRVPEPYRMLLRMFYVDRERPAYIAKFLSLRPEAFPSWMRNARAMVANRLRRQGI